MAIGFKNVSRLDEVRRVSCGCFWFPTTFCAAQNSVMSLYTLKIIAGINYKTKLPIYVYCDSVAVERGQGFTHLGRVWNDSKIIFKFFVLLTRTHILDMYVFWWKISKISCFMWDNDTFFNRKLSVKIKTQ